MKKKNKNEYFKIECIYINDDTCTVYAAGYRESVLEKGSIYTCEGHPDSIFYSVTTNNKYYGVFEKKDFITLAEWRAKQIDEILKDD